MNQNIFAINIAAMIFLLLRLEECASLCACVCGRVKELTVSIGKQKHAFSKPKTVTKVLYKAQEIMAKRKTSGSGLYQGTLCTVMFCVIIWKETEETF